jgi:hypothetical protein
LSQLLLEHGAIVSQELLKEYKERVGIPENLRQALQARYDEQECCVCYENPADLSDIPCKNKHSKFLCKTCYSGLKTGCPMCYGELGDFR